MPGAPPELVKKPEHRICADCQAREPRWASISLGIIICETCSGIHRGMGTHISKVKSTKLDEWQPWMVDNLKAIGNTRSNAYYEYNVPPGVRYETNKDVGAAGGDKIDPVEGRKLETWIRAKYEKKQFAPPGVDEPSVRVKRGESLDDGGGKSTGGDAATSRGGGASSAAPSVKDTPHSEHRRRRSTSHKRKSTSARSPESAMKSPVDSAMRRASDASISPGWDSAAENLSSLQAWAADAGDAGREGGKEGKKKKKDRESSSRRRKSSDGMSWGTTQEGPSISPGPDYARAMACGPMSPAASAYQAQASGMGPPQMPPQSPAPPPPRQLRHHHHHHHHQHDQPPQQGHQHEAYNHHQHHPHAHHHHQQHEPHQQTQQQYQAQPPPGPGTYAQAGIPAYPSAGDFQSRQGGSLPFGSNGDSKMSSTSGMHGLNHYDGPNPDYFPRQQLPQNAPERRAALLAVARLFKAPETVGLPRSLKLIKPTGFDVQTAEFDPKVALVRRLQPGDPGYKPPRPKALHAATSKDWFDLALPEQRRLSSVPGSTISGPAAFTFNPAAGAAPLGHGGCGVGREAEAASLFQSNNGAGVIELKEELRWLRQEVGSLRQEREQAAAASITQANDLRWAQSVPGVPSNGQLAGHNAAISASDFYSTPGGDSVAASVKLEKNREMFAKLKETLGERAALDWWALQCAGEVAVASAANSNGGQASLGGVAAACGGAVTPVKLANQPLGYASPMPEALSLECGGGPCGPCGLSTPGAVHLGRQPALSEHSLSPGSPNPHDPAVWTVERASLEEYATIFVSLDGNHNGVLDGSEVRDYLNQSGLPPAELHAIWGLCDASYSGSLSMEEFICALHLVRLRLTGMELPAVLPHLLRQSAADFVRSSGSFAGGHGGQPVAQPELGIPQQLAVLAQQPTTPSPQHPGVPLQQPSGHHQQPVAHQASPWSVDPVTLEQYQHLFMESDARSTGYMGQEAARVLLERSGLPTEDLIRIWQLADADLDQRLSFSEFVCAMQLASARCQGVPLPQHLPEELQAFANMTAGGAAGSRSQAPQVPGGIQDNAVHASSPLVISQEAFAGYMQHFAAVPKKDPGFLEGEEVKAQLESSGLPPKELNIAWHLADIGGDGRLDPAEFACVLHLVDLRRQGLLSELPASLPPPLLASLAAFSPGFAALAEASGVASLPDAAAPVQPAGSLSPVSPLPPAMGCGAPQHGHAVDEPPGPWTVTPELASTYRSLFVASAHSNPHYLAPAEAKELLERSGLPPEELNVVWQLSDLDGDGQLALNEFAVAMQLVARRRQGAELPAALPEQLARLNAGEVLAMASRAEAAQSLPGGGLSQPLDEAKFASNPIALESLAAPTPEATAGIGPWVVDAAQFDQYRAIFEATAAADPRFVSAEEGREFMERSQLPPHELARIWELSDLDCDGLLSLPEFVCAVHLVSRRREGWPVPEELPPELLKACAGGAAPGAMGGAISQSGHSPRAGLSPGGRSHVSGLSSLAEPAFRFGLEASLGDDVVAASGMSASWAADQREVEAYRSLFFETPRQDQYSLSPDEAREVLERSDLPAVDLAKIWELSDVDEDGKLTLPEFACAMHLAARRRHGQPLPASLPKELVALMAAVSAGSKSSGTSAPHEVVTQVPPPQQVSDAAHAYGDMPGEPPASLWTVSLEQLRDYKSLFDSLPGTAPGGLCLSEGGLDHQDLREFFERSELPLEDLGAIWRLADVNQDGRFFLGHFVCAIHLISRRRQGHELPAVLPAELAAVAFSSS
eukprot:TRINITY_DN1699_c2_g1_i1.p1 TRINITY_DN1699_c2_g1~~TRINITY_DN1699_c2_g1_i1.p1  ORF type:complete len:1769 (+),score=371.27 TRINITY_DN1699_c2_g1_i1:190-5496(+)